MQRSAAANSNSVLPRNARDAANFFAARCGEVEAAEVPEKDSFK